MKSKALWLVIGVMVVLSLVLVSCGGDTTPTAPAATSATPTTSVTKPTTSASTPAQTSVAPTISIASTTAPPQTGAIKKGGILKIITGIPSNFGVPWTGNAPPDLWYLCPVVETLLITDDAGAPAPRLATAWTVAPDNKSITFTLRKGVKFHDGTDFNAAALKWDLEKYASSPMPELKKITGVDVIDDYTAKVNFSSYDPSFLSFMATGKPGWIVSPTAAQKLGDEVMIHNPVGTGPFMFKSWKQDVSVTLVKNPNYWQEGKPYLDGIEYDMVTDPVTAVIAFKSGAAQVHYNVSQKEGYDLQKEGFNVTAAPASIYQYIPDSANATSPWSKLEVRQAAQYAIDTVAMAKAQGYGWADPYWNQVFPKASVAYNPDIVGYPYNVAKAKELLTKAGYPTGFKTSLYNAVPPIGDLEPAVQNYLAAVGIQAEMKPLAGAAYTAANTGGWSNGLFRSQSVASLGADPLYQMNTYLSTPAKSWVSLARPQDMQDLLTAANSEPDPAKRTAIVKNLCKNLIDTNAMIISTWGGYLLAAKDKSVTGGNIRDKWTMTWLPENCWLNK